MIASEDFLLSSYDYELPHEQIAQYPPHQRGCSRLMVLRPHQSPIHATFRDIVKHLPPHSLLVGNNSKVIPARLNGKRPSGGKAELLLLTPLPLLRIEPMKHDWHQAEADALLRPAGRLKCGDTICFSANLSCEVLAKGNFGHCAVKLVWNGSLQTALEEVGMLPLPPYIRRSPQREDYERYQTCYARESGSIAAPTAGLHFTPEIHRELLAQGHEWAEVTLHVGYGTFSPVRCEDIRDHQMHAEYAAISIETAGKINRASREGRPIIAVGTTSMRVLEGLNQAIGEIGPYEGMINAFLYPGKPISMVRGIITNFHLPKSTLLMLVAALAGRKRILQAYAEAVKTNYRFFSYGDAMLILQQ